MDSFSRVIGSKLNSWSNYSPQVATFVRPAGIRLLECRTRLALSSNVVILFELFRLLIEIFLAENNRRTKQRVQKLLIRDELHFPWQILGKSMRVSRSVLGLRSGLDLSNLRQPDWNF